MSLNIEQLKALVKHVIHQIIGDEQFSSDRLKHWHAEILKEIIERLKEIEEKKTRRNAQMKYVVTLLIGEKNESMQRGFHTALACLWDGSTDGCLTVKWENRTIFAIATVFALSL